MTSGRPDASGIRPSPQRNRPSGTPTLRGADADGRDRTTAVVMTSETTRLPLGLTAAVHLRRPPRAHHLRSLRPGLVMWASADDTPLGMRAARRDGTTATRLHPRRACRAVSGPPHLFMTDEDTHQ